MKKQYINPASLFDSRPFGFSQAVSTEMGKMVFVSGQVGWDTQMQIVGKGDLEQQAEKALQNLKSALAAAGASLEDVVMLRIYTVRYQDDDGAVISRALQKHFNPDHPPASTWIHVNGLAHADFLIEIEAQAVV